MFLYNSYNDTLIFHPGIGTKQKRKRNETKAHVILIDIIRPNNWHPACKPLRFPYPHSTRLRNNMARVWAVFGGNKWVSLALPCRRSFHFLACDGPRACSRFCASPAVSSSSRAQNEIHVWKIYQRSCKRINIVKLNVCSVQRKYCSRSVVTSLWISPLVAL